MLPPVSSAVLSFSASPNSAWVDFRADDDASTTTQSTQSAGRCDDGWAFGDQRNGALTPPTIAI